MKVKENKLGEEDKYEEGRCREGKCPGVCLTLQSRFQK